MKTIGMDMALRNSAIAIELDDNKYHYIIMTEVRKVEKLNQEDNITSIFTKKLPYTSYVKTLQDELDKFDYDLIILEGHAIRAKGTAIYQTHEFIGVIKYLNRFKDMIILMPTQIKKLHTGSGNASKNDMFGHCDKEFGDWVNILSNKYKLKTDEKGLSDIIDAYAILQIGLKDKLNGGL